MFAGAAKKLKVRNFDCTDSALDWAANGVREVDEIRTIETLKGQDERDKSASNIYENLAEYPAQAQGNCVSGRAIAVCRRGDGESCKLTIRAATENQFGDAAPHEDPKRFLTTLVSNEEGLKFCMHDKIMNLMTQAQTKTAHDRTMTKLRCGRQGSEALDSLSGDLGDQTTDRLVKRSVDFQLVASLLKSFHAEEGTSPWYPMVLLDAIKAHVDVGHAISSLAWSAVLRRGSAKPGASKRIGRAKRNALTSAAWLLLEINDATSSLQEKAVLEMPSEVIQQNEAAAVAILAEAAPVTWIMMPAFSDYSSSLHAVVIHDDGVNKQCICVT